ncbi:MAG: IclR family transcriptional regulator [Alphaproteobacteria bacterium]
MSQKYANRSVDRALDILEYLDVHRQPMRITDIARGVGLSVGTTYRLLEVLVGRRFVFKNSSTRRYTLGFEVFRIGATGPAMQITSARAKPLLARLAADLEADVFIGARDGIRVQILDRLDGAKVGNRTLNAVDSYVDAHACAIGKVLLAYQVAGNLDAQYVHQTLPRHTANTVTSITRLAEDLAEVLATGHAVENEELVSGMSGIAVPIINIAGDAYLAVWVVCPTGTFTSNWRKRALARTKVVARMIAEYRASEA